MFHISNIKCLLFFIFFSIIYSFTFSQNTCTDTAFRKKYSASVGSTITSQIILNNSNILINSSSTFPIDSLKRSVISRIQKDGTIIWSKKITQNNQADGIFIQQMEELNNGDIILAGEYINNLNNSLNQRRYLFTAQLNSTGNILWNKVFVLSNSFDNKPYVNIQSITIDNATNNFYISLFTPSMNSNNDNGIAAFSSSGNLIWYKHISYPINNSLDSIELVTYKGLQIIGNELICIGDGSKLDFDYQAILLTHRINKLNGTIISSKIFERYID